MLDVKKRNRRKLKLVEIEDIYLNDVMMFVKNRKSISIMENKLYILERVIAEINNDNNIEFKNGILFLFENEKEKNIILSHLNNIKLPKSRYIIKDYMDFTWCKKLYYNEYPYDKFSRSNDALMKYYNIDIFSNINVNVNKLELMKLYNKLNIIIIRYCLNVMYDTFLPGLAKGFLFPDYFGYNANDYAKMCSNIWNNLYMNKKVWLQGHQA